MTEHAARQAVGAYPLPARREPELVRLRPRLRWRVTQSAADLVTVFAAAMGTYWLYLLSGLGQQHYLPGFYAQLNLAIAVVTVFALHGHGAYRGSMGLLRIEAVRKILHAVGSGILLTLAISFLVKLPTFSRLTVLFLGPAIVLALVTQRFLWWSLQDRMRAARGTTAPVLVYGAGETGRLLARHLLDEHPLGLRPVGFLDDDATLHGIEMKIGPGTEGVRLPILGSADALDEAIARTGASTVFLAMPSASSERVGELVARLESRALSYFVVPGAGEQLFSSLQFGQLAGMPVFTRRRPAANRVYEIAKRAIDVGGASLLLLLSLPLLAVAALLIKLTSPGPVLFTQTRIGLGGRPFTIFKLRTMGRHAPRYALHPDDPRDERVTLVGRWLRKLSIDELPQLWNVLRGEMSLVGPRPEMPFVVARYNEIQRQRLTVSPGVTGLWQISADRAFKIHHNVHYDLYYVENRGLSLDLAVLVLTPFVLLARNRAM